MPDHDNSEYSLFNQRIVERAMSNTSDGGQSVHEASTDLEDLASSDADRIEAQANTNAVSRAIAVMIFDAYSGCPGKLPGQMAWNTVVCCSRIRPGNWNRDFRTVVCGSNRGFGCQEESRTSKTS